MSRRGRHGRHSNPGVTRPGTVAPERPAGVVETRPGAADDAQGAHGQQADRAGRAAHDAEAELAPIAPPVIAPPAPPAVEDRGPAFAPAPVRTPVDGPVAQGEGPDAREGRDQHDDSRPSCTTAQLRRFIKSRPWVPMHELRRRFGIWGGDDDVSPMRVADKTLFIGLPPSEARMMAELLAGGDVGYELSLDPVAPIVVGVYPMRPVPRS